MKQSKEVQFLGLPHFQFAVLGGIKLNRPVMRDAFCWAALLFLLEITFQNPSDAQTVSTSNHESLESYLSDYKTIYDPVFSRQGKLQFDFPLGLTLNHPFKSGIVLPLGTLTWHLTHRWSWEVINPSLIIPWNNALTGALLESRAQLNFPVAWGGLYSNIVYTPIYGKIRLWKQDSTPLYFSLIMGAGGLLLTDQIQDSASNFRFNLSFKGAVRMTAMLSDSIGIHGDLEIRSFGGSGLLGNEISLISFINMGISWIL